MSFYSFFTIKMTYFKINPFAISKNLNLN